MTDLSEEIELLSLRLSDLERLESTVSDIQEQRAQEVQLLKKVFEKYRDKINDNARRIKKLENIIKGDVDE